MKIFSPRDHPPTDADILSFWQMMFAPDQTQWDYEDNAHLVHIPDAEVIHFVRNTVLTRETNHGFWAREDGHIVGMVGLNLFTEPSKSHCAELGFSVRAAYRLRGTVSHGRGRGVKLGFPTANLEGATTLLPGEGIYAGRTLIDGQLRPAAISLGPNPTFDEGNRKVEGHVIDFQGRLYDREIEVDFLSRLRDIVRFDSVDRLISQMEIDVAAARDIAGRLGP